MSASCSVRMRIGYLALYDVRSTLSAICRNDPSIFIPAGHPLADDLKRAFFAEALTRIAQPEAAALPVIEPADDPDAATVAPICLLGAGYVAAALTQAAAEIATLPASPLRQRLLTLCQTEFRDFLLEQLAPKVQQTVVLEFNIALMDDPDLTLDQFCLTLDRADQRDRIFAEYPLLASRLGVFFHQQAQVFAGFAKRLAADWDMLPDALGCDLSRTLPRSLSFGEGDFHNGGQSVIIVTCDDGQKCVYKPRDIAVEAAFDDLLGGLNDALGDDVFFRVRSLPRAGYGWVAFIAAEPCKNKEEVTTFYERIGGLLAVLHLLGGFDLHQENLIGHGAYPVVVDLETLFFSFKNSSFLGRDDPFLGAATYPAVKALLGSVMSTLMLPQHARNENVSGIAGGDTAPRMALRYNPDRNRVEYQQAGTVDFLNRPTLDEQAVSPGPYAADIERGFARLYGHFAGNKAIYASDKGPIAQVAAHMTRVVVRDTQIYTTLLEQSWHPALLGHPANLVVHFLQIWQAAADTPSTIPLVPYELEQLLAGDVPYFTQGPMGVQIMTGGGEVVAGYTLDRSGFAAMQDRLAAMSLQDMALQCWIIRGALETDLRDGKGTYARPDVTTLAPDAEMRALGLVHAAVMQHAQRGNGLLDWLTVTPTPDEKLMLAPVDVTLYNGISGLTLYLAYHAAVTGGPVTDAQEAFANLERQIADDWGNFPTPGAMSGLGGAAYCMTHLAVLWGRPALFDRAFELLIHDAALVAGDDGLFDITVGAAGLICVACAGFEASGQDRFRDLSRELGARLMAMARHDEKGAYWVAQEGEKPLTGLSHGFSGVILAFARLHQIAPDPAILAVAQAAMARENTDFVPARNNWIDWRYANLQQAPRDDPSSFQYFWCNGGAGIGLARLALLEAGGEHDQVRRDIAAAARGTLDGGIGHNHSLCHGDLGNVDFILQAAAVLGDDGLQQHGKVAYARAVNAILDGHIFGGASRSVAPPDLMTGLSGVGYGLLRQIAPDLVPDLLRLAAPRTPAR